MAVFLPSSALIGYLRIALKEPHEQLLLGANLFKIGLAILGFLAIVLAKLPIYNKKRSKLEVVPKSHNNIYLTVFATLFLIAFILRLYRLDNGLWLDEILTDVNYARTSFGEIVTTYDSQNQHFLYSILAHASFLIFGESAWSLRLPAVIFGVASIWALFLLSRKVASNREALLTCALLAFSYHHIWFSQNARGYTGLLFWTIFSTWLFIRGLKEEHIKLWIFYALAAAFGAFTLITMVLIVTGHFTVYLATLYARRNQNWPGKWIPLVGFVLAVAFTFQLYALVLPQAFAGTIQQGSQVAIWKSPLWALFEFVRGFKISFMSIIPAILSLPIFIAGLWSFARENRTLIALHFLPLVFILATALIMKHHLWPRVFFFLLGFGVLVVVRGCMQIGNITHRLFKFQRLTAPQLGTTLCIALILVSAGSIPSVYGPKQDYLGAVSFLEKSRIPGDVIVIVGAATIPFKHYYGVDWKEVEVAEDLKAIRSEAKRTWLAYTLPPHLDAAYPEIMEIIRNDFKLIKQFYGTLNGGTIYVSRFDIPLK